MPRGKAASTPAVDKDVMAWLKQAEKDWEQQAAAAAEEPEYTEIEDGKYIGKLNKAEITKSDKGMSAHFVFVIAEGTYKGRTVHKWDGLEREESLKYLAKTLRRFGYDVDPSKLKASALPKLFNELTEEQPYTKLQLRTKPDSDFQNVYVNGIAEDYTPEDEDEEEDEEEVELEVGMTVLIEVDGEEAEGEVTKINEKTGKVSVKVGRKTHIVDAEEISLPEDEDSDEEDEDEEAEIEEGSRVTDGEREGEVVSISGTKAKVKWDGGKRTATVSLDSLELVEEEEDEEDEEEEDEEEAVELEVGMSVSFAEGKKTLEGTVTKINEKTGKVSVKVGTKTYIKDAEELEALDAEDTDEEEEEEEEEPTPPARTRRSRK